MKSRAPLSVLFASAVVTSALALACSDSSAPGGSSSTSGAAPAKPTAAQPEAAADPVAEGRKVYLGNCIACHNPDPKLDGPLGPAIAGSSAALIEARVVHGEYPEGYTPKRQTRNMVPLPYLAPKVDLLAAYLQSEG
jgi:mono/diheme cytochrome c family protein